MHKLIIILLSFLLCIDIFAFDIVKNGKATGTVVLSKNPSDIDIYAKDEFIKNIKTMTGIELPVSDTPSKEYNIFIGQAGEDYLGQDILKSKKPDTVLIKTKYNNLILAGVGSGTIYSVYSFLEDYCGIKYILATEDYIPKKKSLSVPNIDYIYTPVFESRSTDCIEHNYKPEYDLKLKLNGNFNTIDIKLGGSMETMFVSHSFQWLLPSSTYFQDHPDWYSEITGVRQKENYQLCLTNKEMTNEFIKNTLNCIENNPNIKIFSISQNDNKCFCTCPECTKMTEKYGHSGLLLYFVNQVADAVKEKYPHVFLETLAYQYTREAPKGGITPRDNVIVRLCSIETESGHNLKSITNKEYYKDLTEWSKIAPKLYTWDYHVNYDNFVIPHANLKVFQENYQIENDLGVDGVFTEGDFFSQNPGCLGQLRRYMIAKLMWDPYLNFDKEAKDFCKAFYGKAGNSMFEFMLGLDRPFRDSNEYILPVYVRDNNYYNEKDWDRGFRCLDKAIKTATNNTYNLNNLTEDCSYINNNDNKYFNRVLFDIICYQAGYELTSKEIKDKTEKLKTPKLNHDLFLKLLGDFAIKQGLTTVNEKSIWFLDYTKKTAPAPIECKDLKNDEWADYQQDSIELYFPFGDYVQDIDDPEASDGKAYAFTPTTVNWFGACYLTNLYALSGYKSADIYCTYKIVNPKKDGPCLELGTYSRNLLKQGWNLKLYTTDTPDNKYVTKKIGEIDLENFDRGLYIWIGSVNDDPCDWVYIDRFFAVFK